MSQELEEAVRKLQAIEEIKNLHARYVYYLDGRQAEKIPDLFADNFVADYEPHGRVTTKRDLLELMKGFISVSAMTCHSSTTPLIEVEGDKATGIWVLFGPQTAITPEGQRATWVKGKYENEYAKVNGKWKMSLLKVRMDIVCPYEDGWVKTPIGSWAEGGGRNS